MKQLARDAHLFDGPFSFKGMKVTFHHFKFNIPPPTKRQDLKISLIAI